MKKYLLVFVLFFFINSVHAVTITDPLLFNFQGSPGAMFTVPFPSVGNPALSIDDVTVTGPVNTNPMPWLNGPVNDGGLGVCNLGVDCIAGASPTNALEDDETVRLRFSTSNPFDLTTIYFLNANNGTDFDPDSQFGFQVNDGPTELFSLVHMFNFAMGDVPTLDDGDYITFLWGGDVFGGIGEDYFIGGLVPIPAALPLFLSGLFGFAFFSRKKKVAAA